MGEVKEWATVPVDELEAQETGKPVELFCAIGDTKIDGKPYSEIVEIARDFINQKGGWGLI